MKLTRHLLRLLALLFSFALIAAACGGSDDSSDSGGDDSSSDSDADSDDSDGESSGGDTISIAIVAPSASDDLAFTQSMIDAIEALDRDVDLQITDGTFVVDDAAAAIRGYAVDGVDVVIAHGTQFGGSLAEIAPEFPEVTFIWGTSSDTQGLDNVFAYFPAADEGGYVNGVLAAAVTETGNIGVIGPVEAGDAVAYINGFEKGATDSGDVSVAITYTGSFSDVALMAEAAQAHLSNDVDVLTGSSQAVVGAVGVASENDIPWFGTQANQTSLDENLVVASQVYHWEVVLEEMLALRDAGTLGGEAFEVNLENGGLEIEFNDNFELPDGAREAADAAIEGIIDGSIDTGA